MGSANIWCGVDGAAKKMEEAGILREGKRIGKMNGIEGGNSGVWGKECVYSIPIRGVWTLPDSYQRAWVSSRTRRDTLMRPGPKRHTVGGCVWVTFECWSHVRCV